MTMSDAMFEARSNLLDHIIACDKHLLTEDRDYELPCEEADRLRRIVQEITDRDRSEGDQS